MTTNDGTLGWYRKQGRGEVLETAHQGLHLWRPEDRRWYILVTDAEGTGCIGESLCKTKAEALAGVEKVAARRQAMPVSILNPDDEWDMPIYEGPANQAHTELEPGLYQTTVGHYVQVTDDESTLVPFGSN